VLEAVPNFSEGRDLDWLRELVGVIGGTGVEVLDASADPDHNRSVVTFVGDPGSVEAAAIAAARFALERIDLRRHRGVHPRVGALDVLPFVPLQGLAISDAVKSAHRVGTALAGLGLPVYFYGEASTPPGRRLAELRRGGFEALVEAFPEGRAPDLDGGLRAAHPTAGVACVGARRLLLAWNVYLEGVELERVRALAGEVRELGGGFASLRALALRLESNDRLQLSMNLEDLDRTSPFDVFRHVEERVQGWGGRVTGTEVIGMIPDPLVLPAATDRLLLLDSPPSRLLSTRLARHVAERAARHAEALLQAVRDEGEAVPARVREAAFRLSGSLIQPPSPPPTPDSDR
jgi:glutamate formiminotransferase